jgi:DNA-binding transcriptional MerR regulator
MSSRNTISDVASRTGFTPSALRFYENAGLITPERTDAGYRIYDERAVERLRFIARAKQLGLSLDEITELVVLWDGDQCAPVAQRLRDLVAEKITETQTRVAELIAFASDLQRFSTALATGSHDGPCGDGCACHGDSGAVGVSLVTKPTVAAPDQPPIACTLHPSQMSGRMEHWQAVVARSEGLPQRIDGGLILRFPVDPELAATIGALAAAEQSCCNFFTFQVRMNHTGTELAVIAPTDAAPLVDAMFGVPA